jgi:hypothetical protein
LGFGTSVSAFLACTALTAATIDFNTLPGSNFSVFSTYSENGYTVTPIAGAWKVATAFGNPVPDVFCHVCESGTLQVTGGTFNFVSVDIGNPDGVGAIGYTIAGFLSGVRVLLQSGDSSPNFDVFTTVDSVNSSQLLDTLNISLHPPPGFDGNVDNIALKSAPVPEPGTVVLLLAGLGALAMTYRRRRTLLSLTVLTAAAFLHFGASPVRAQSTDGRLFVDRDRGRLGASCTNSDPCARITDALSIARAMRYGLDPAIQRLQPHKRINITVRASASPYLGSPDPARLAANPSLEALPLFLNISDLDLAGESKFTTDADGWIVENSVSDATIIKSEAPLPGLLALILMGLSEGTSADDVTVRGFVLDGNTQPSSAGILIGVDRAQRFLIRDTYQINSTYGVVAQGSSGFVEQSFLSQLAEGVLVFGGNATWPSEVTVRNTRSIANSFGGLAFFGSSYIVNGLSAVADFGAYKGVFQPVEFKGVVDRTVGHVIHNDLSRNTTTPNLTCGLRMALIGPGLPAGQSAGNLSMTVIGNRLNDNAHAFMIDAGFPFRSSPDMTGSFTGWFEGNEATGSLTAKALVTFTRNNAAETLPGSMATWKYLVNSSYRVMYSSGEFDDAPGPGGRAWIDNPDVDPTAPSQTLTSELILQAR